MSNWVFLIFLKEPVKIKNPQKGFLDFCSLMDDFPEMLYGWSWEENKLFEVALAAVDEANPDRWEEVAAMIGGKKSAEDVKKHYVILLEDLKCIESGELDHTIDSTQSVCWTDEDHKLLVQLDIN